MKTLARFLRRAADRLDPPLPPHVNIYSHPQGFTVTPGSTTTTGRIHYYGRTP